MLKINQISERNLIEYGIHLANRWQYQGLTEKTKRIIALSHRLVLAPTAAYREWKKEKEVNDIIWLWILYHFLLECLVSFDVIDHWKTSLEMEKEKKRE